VKQIYALLLDLKVAKQKKWCLLSVEREKRKGRVKRSGDGRGRRERGMHDVTNSTTVAWMLHVYAAPGLYGARETYSTQNYAAAVD